MRAIGHISLAIASNALIKLCGPFVIVQDGELVLGGHHGKTAIEIVGLSWMNEGNMVLVRLNYDWNSNMQQFHVLR